MLTRNFGNLQQQFFAVYRAGRVIRINNHDGFGFRADFGADIVQIRKPSGFFVTQIMTYRTARQRRGCRPQRVIGSRDEDFVAVIEQRLHRHGNQLGHAVADVNIVYAHIHHVFGLVIMHDCLARRIQPFGIAIALSRRQITDHVYQHLIRRFKTKRCGISDIQLEDFMPFLFQADGFAVHRAADIVANMIKL